MQLSYGIYYSTYVNSSTCFERYVAHHQKPQLYLSLWFTNACGDRPWCRLSSHSAQIQLRLLMMSDITLETCWNIDISGLINSVTELHLVGDLLLVILGCTVPWILNVIKMLWNKDNFSNKFTQKDSILFILF
jgi:hypothetical protein